MTSPRSTEVSIVVLCHNRKDIIEGQLAALLALADEAGCELIVVDNASTDGSAKIVEEILAKRRNVRAVLNDRNLGVSAGRNAGWREASGRFILSVDDDIQLTVPALAAMVRAAEDGRDGCIVSPDIADSITGEIINKVSAKEEYSASFYEACFLVPRNVLEQVGYLDEKLEAAGEGLDYSLRLRRAGLKIRRLSAARVVHVDRVRTGLAAAERRRRWLWSFCYVYWKNEDPLSAAWHSLRVAAAHAKVGGRMFGLSFVASLPYHAFSGARAGLAKRVR